MKNDELCWIDRLRSRMPFRDPLLLACALGILTYLVAVIPLLVTGQFLLARQSPVILGMMGISWSLLFYWVGSQDYVAYLDSLEDALTTEALHKYRALRNGHLLRLRNDRSHFIVTFLVWMLGGTLVTLEMYHITEGGFLRTFPPEWSSQELRLARLGTILIFGAPTVLLLWTLGRLIILHTVFLARISRLEYLPSQYICFMRLRPLLWINILGAFGWSIGVAFFGLLFRHRYGIGHIVFLIILQAVATVAFFWPTWLFKIKMKRIGMERVDKLIAAARDRLILLSGDDSKSWQDLFVLEDEMAKQTSDFSLTIGWRYVGYVLTTFVLPVATAILATLATKYFENAPK